MPVEENKVTVRRFIEALDTDDLGELGDLCNPEIAEEYGRGINTGPFREYHLAITEIVAEDDKVMVVLANRGVHTGGEFYGIPPSGKRWTGQVPVLLRLEGGKIAEVVHYFDDLSTLKQLGATITPPAPTGS
jgi:ketosteroid isomerase-like protein